MRKLARSLIRLYPASWRARYGEEFEALLEDSSPGWAGVFDLLKGAVRMQFSVRSFSKLAGGLAVGGMLIGLAISFVVAPRYVSTAVMRVTPGLERSLPFNPGERLMETNQEALIRTLSRIAQDPRIRIHVDSPGSHKEPLAFSVSFAYNDPVKAQQTGQAAGRIHGREP
jgi:hypothetical protein